jgi:gas vesicle protein
MKNAVTGATSNVLPSGEQVSRLKDTAERNPLGLVIGGAALGFVAGLLLPSTRIEDEKMGEISDRVVDAAKETAGDAIESGKQVAQDAAQSAANQGQELASNMQERTQESLSQTQHETASP